MADGAFTAPLPHNMQAEQALLGSIMFSNSQLERVIDLIDAADFYEPLHGMLFDLMRSMIAAGTTANPITIKSKIDHLAPIGDMTVADYVGRVLKVVALGGDHPVAYAKTIAELAEQRALLEAMDAARAQIFNKAPTSEARSTLETAVASRRKGSKPDVQNAYEAACEVIDDALAAYERGGGLAGLSTGFKSLDEVVGGMAPGDLIVLAGRPGMGKTALGADIAFNAAMAGVPSFFFSLEMKSKQIMARKVAEHSGVGIRALRRGLINQSAAAALMKGKDGFKSLPLWFDHSGGLDISQVAIRARRYCRLYGIKLMVVDYIQIVNGPAGKSKTATEEVTAVSNGLKALAMELDIPIIALAQLSRKPEDRDDKRPLLSDLRQSGAIEQDADIVMFPFREEYYLEKEQPREGSEDFLAWQDMIDARRGKAEVIIAKHRQDSCGTAFLRFDAVSATFADPESAS
jgi:replicative DNA helicase